MPECPTCGQQTPAGNFCVRCGAPLDQGLNHSHERTRFAAAPAQRRYAPWLISTLFPHLPRHAERHFRLALGAGVSLVILLGALRLFPVALVAAAVLMPLLTALYLYDANVYGSDPLWAYGWTMVWGAAAGIGLGFLSRAAASTGSALIDRGSSSHVLIGGAVVPILALLAALIGTLVLFARRRFDEVLDGTTFAATTAATLAAAEAVMVGAGVLSSGLSPPGAAAPWVARLVATAVATPVLTMSAAALVGAAIWLRYRAPMKDRAALGPLGVPLIAAATAVLLVVAGASGETFLPAGAWLAWLLVLDLVGLTLLRRTLHVGLLEEASERDIGPPIRCANCQAMTTTHTFCSNCGISLKAMPKPSVAADPVRGSSAGRLAAERRGRWSNHRRVLVSAVGLSAVLASAFAAEALAAARITRAARCHRGVPCGKPPVGPSGLPHYVAWHSSGLGFSLRYNGAEWTAQSQGADGLTLEPTRDRAGSLTVTAVPASEATPRALLTGRVSSLQGELLGMTPDPFPSDQILGANVGFQPGLGAVYTGTTTTPQGPQTLVVVALVAAANPRMSILVTAIAAQDDIAQRSAVYQSADDIINSIQWPA